MPKIGEHADAAALDLGGLRILILIDQVLVDRQVHQLMHLRSLPGLAEGGQVLLGVAIKEQLFGDRLMNRVRLSTTGGKVIPRQLLVEQKLRRRGGGGRSGCRVLVRARGGSVQRHSDDSVGEGVCGSAAANKQRQSGAA